MGLDTVELVIAYEQEFNISISDAAAVNLVTVGLVCDFIVEATRSKDPAPDPEYIWKRIVEITSEQLSIKPEMITRNSKYVQDLGCD